MENVREVFLPSVGKGRRDGTAGSDGKRQENQESDGKKGRDHESSPPTPSAPTIELLESPGNLIPLSPAFTPPSPLINGKG